MVNRATSRVSGFTLVELMVTLTVLAVVLVAAVPAFNDFFDKYRLRGAADDVVSLIANARAESVKADRDVRIMFGGNWCLGANAAAEPAAGAEAAGPQDCDCTNAAQCVVGGQRMAIDDGRHAGIATSASTFPFDFDSKLGLVTTLAAESVTLTSPSGKYDMTININPLGQASVCVPAGKPAVSGVQPC